MTDKVPARNLVKQLNDDREANRCVQVAFRNMETETFRDQAQADHQQEAQTEHHHRRMLVDEVRQRFWRQ